MRHAQAAQTHGDRDFKPWNTPRPSDAGMAMAVNAPANNLFPKEE